MNAKNNTHFGFETVSEQEKNKRVRSVFNSVASRYDLMNDVMSLGLHRLWKKFLLQVSGIQATDKVLDIAGGSGDLSYLIYQRVKEKGEIILSDINQEMLQAGRNKLIDKGIFVPIIQCDAEQLPFPNNTFDCVVCGFGLRNMTHKDKTLKEIYQVLKYGGRLLILEFSKANDMIAPIYDTYSFKILPKLGRFFARDEQSYQYLVESIRMHPDQESLKKMIGSAGFKKVEYYNLCAGIVAVHKAWKI